MPLPVENVKRAGAPLVYTLLSLLVILLHFFFILDSSRVIGGARYFCLLDDPMISMNYARNLAAGNGLVWSVGEAPPVEGFSNPLWTFWMSLVHLLPIPPSKMSLLVMLSGSALLLGDLFVLAALARREGPDSTAIPPVIFFLVGTSFPLIYWTLGGFEVGLVSLLVDAILLLSLTSSDGRRSIIAALLLALVPIVRMDALLPASAVALALVITAEPHRRIARAALLFGSLLLSMVLQTVFRLFYFGEWLPNTYYLKMSGIPIALRLEKGIEYFLRRLPQLLLPVAFAAVELTACWKHRTLSPAKLAFGMIALLQVAYAIYVGGDAWEEEPLPNRFLSTALPGLIYLATFGAFRSGSWFLRRAIPSLATTSTPLVAIASALLFLALLFPLPGRLAANEHAFHVAHAGIRRAIVIRAATDKDATVLVTGAGALPYFLDRRTFDFLGKCDRVVAHGPMALQQYYRPGHSKWNYLHSVGHLQPDVIAQTHHDPRPWLPYLRDQGYAIAPNGMLVRRSSNKVREEMIGLDPMSDLDLLICIEVLEKRGDLPR